MLLFRVLHPEYRIPYLRLWSSFYVNRHRVDHVQDAAKAAELQAIKLEKEYEVTRKSPRAFSDSPAAFDISQPSP